jgi:hypothetical protein
MEIPAPAVEGGPGFYFATSYEARFGLALTPGRGCSGKLRVSAMLPEQRARLGIIATCFRFADPDADGG